MGICPEARKGVPAFRSSPRASSTPCGSADTESASRCCFFVLFAFVYVKAVMGNAWTSQALLQYEGDVAVGDIQRQSRFAMAPAAEVLTRRSLLKKVQEVANYQGSVIALRNSIDYKLDFNASTLRITVAAGSAKGAAELARHVTDVFLEHHSDRQSRRIEQELQRLQVRLDGAKAESKDARNRYAAFLDEHGIPHGELEEGSTGADVVETLAQSELIASEVRALEARVASLQAQLSEMPKTTSLAGSDPAREAYDALRSELAVARASLSPDHPRVRSLEEQVAKLSRQLRRGGGDVNVVENDAYSQLSRELREAEWQLASLRERQKGLEAIAASAQRRADAITGGRGGGRRASCGGRGQRSARRPAAGDRSGARGRARDTAERVRGVGPGRGARIPGREQAKEDRLHRYLWPRGAHCALLRTPS